MADMLLEVEDLHTYYGESHILQGVSLAVAKGATVALMGRNGAGKTTTLRSIMGLIKPRRGRVRFDGRDVAGRKTYEVAQAGMALVITSMRWTRRMAHIEDEVVLDIGFKASGRRILYDEIHRFARRRAEFGR